jgi:hypothetical protein
MLGQNTSKVSCSNFSSPIKEFIKSFGWVKLALFTAILDHNSVNLRALILGRTCWPIRFLITQLFRILKPFSFGVCSSLKAPLLSLMTMTYFLNPN